MKISDKQRMLMEFDERRGIVFLMLQKEVSNNKMARVYSIKLKQTLSGEDHPNSDSEEEKNVVVGGD